MGNIDIVQILGVGLSGFGFLLMYLAYRLINRIITEKTQQKSVLGIIKIYMLVCFIMTVTVGVFTFMSTSYKNNVISDQEKKIEEKSSALNVLVATNNSNSMLDSLLRLSQNDINLVNALKEQRETLDTLSKYIDQQHDSTLNVEFNKYKTLILDVSDSLTLTGLRKPSLDSLKLRLLDYKTSMNEISLRVAKSISPDIHTKNNRLRRISR